MLGTLRWTNIDSTIVSFSVYYLKYTTTEVYYELLASDIKTTSYDIPDLPLQNTVFAVRGYRANGEYSDITESDSIYLTEIKEALISTTANSIIKSETGNLSPTSITFTTNLTSGIHKWIVNNVVKTTTANTLTLPTFDSEIVVSVYVTNGANSRVTDSIRIPYYETPALTLTSNVFKRGQTVPDTPTGGTYASPIPAEWSDGIPASDANNLPVWLSVRKFTSNGLPPQSTEWSTPTQLTSNSTTKFEYSVDSSSWHEVGTTNDVYMRTTVNKDGTNTVSVVKVKGEKGEQGQGQTMGVCFKRSATALSTAPTGGSFSSPTATDWSDGIPTGTDQLYSSSRLFTSDGLSPQQATWSIPSAISKDGMTGNGTKLQFSVTSLSNDWHDTPDINDIYMRSGTAIAGGAYTYTGAVKIKGETGLPGQGQVKAISFCRHTTAPNAPLATDGSFSSPNAAGTITTGSPAVSVTGNVWSDGIPSGTAQLYMATRLFTSDALTPQQAAWTTPIAISQKGDTGPGSKLRYIFSASTSATAPALPDTNITADTTDWKLTGTSTARWMSVQVNTLDATNTTVTAYGAWSTAALIKGEKGDSALNATLSNQYQGIPCDKNGTPLTGAFNTASTTMRVYKGSTDITANCTFSFTKTASVTVNTTAGYLTSNTQTVTGLSESTGSVSITATETASGSTIIAVFTLAKQLQGADGNFSNGNDAVLYEVSADSLTTVKSLTGTYSPTTITFSSYRTVGNGTKTAYAVYWRTYIDGTEVNAVADNLATSSATKQVTVSGSSTVSAKGYSHPSRADTYLLDIETTTIVPAGPKGDVGIVTQGDTGLTGAGSVVVYKAGSMSSFPAKPTATTYGAATTTYTTEWKINSADITLDATKNILFQCDGNYPAGSTTITWSDSYPSLLKVGTLDALAVKTGTLTSASSGRKLTINESGQHEFRCLDASGNQVATMGDDGSTSNEEIFRADLRYTQTYGQANSNSYGFNAELASSMTGRGANYTATGFQAATQALDSFVDIGKSPRILSILSRMQADALGNINSGYGGAFISSLSNPAKRKRAFLAMDQSGIECGGYFDYYSYYADELFPNLPDTNVQLANATEAVNAYGAIKTNSTMSAYNYVTLSDQRLKDDLKIIPDALSKVNLLTGYSFTWNDKADRHPNSVLNDVGVIAQDVQEVLPQAVFENKDGYLGVDYTSLIPLLINAIKELDKKYNELLNRTP
jgi:hypothetical protein